MSNFNQDTQNYIQELKQGTNNILVSVRVRPLNFKEISQTDFEIVRVLDQKLIVLLDPGNEFQYDDVFRKNRNKETQFAFDFAFDKFAEQQIIYDKSCSFVVPAVIDGYNATIFSYGATGAGKTYTMLGNNDHPGVMLRCLNELFSNVDTQLANFRIKLSYLEIYNENIRDLLTSDDRTLDLREDPKAGIQIAGITEVQVSAPSEVVALLKIGNKNRTKESTSANDASSRSHAILQLTLIQKEKLQGINEQLKECKLTLVDLAGSERAAHSNNKGMRMIEGAKINQSLLVLGNCIQALSEAHEKVAKINFIPYRNSKLTRILKDSLGGNCRTVMIATVSPAVTQFEDTYNTLMYAHRAKSIKNAASRNVLQVINHVSNYANMIQQLRSENEDLKKQLSSIHSIHQQVQKTLNPNQNYAEKLEMDINSHFSEEREMKTKIFELQEKQNTQNLQLQLHQNELNKLDKKQYLEQSKIIEKIEFGKKEIQLIDKSIQDLENQYKDLISHRLHLQQAIKSGDLGIANTNFLNSLLRQGNTSIDNLDIQLLEKRQENIVKSQDIQIQFLKQQIKYRDDVLEESSRYQHYKNEEKQNKKINSLQDLSISQIPSLKLPKVKQINYNPYKQQQQPKHHSFVKLPKIKYNLDSSDISNIRGKANQKQIIAKSHQNIISKMGIHIPKKQRLTLDNKNKSVENTNISKTTVSTNSMSLRKLRGASGELKKHRNNDFFQESHHRGKIIKPGMVYESPYVINQQKESSKLEKLKKINTKLMNAGKIK